MSKSDTAFAKAFQESFVNAFRESFKESFAEAISELKEDLAAVKRERDELRKWVDELEREQGTYPPIEFSDESFGHPMGIIRRIEWDEGDPSVGIGSGYVAVEPHPDTTDREAADEG